MHDPKKNEFCQDEKGGQMLEFALILPFVSIVLFGVIQYGLIFAAFISLRSAAATVARFTVLLNSNPDDATTVAKEALAGILATDDVTASCTDTNVSGVNDAKRCSITYRYKTIFPVPGTGADGRFVIVAESIMK